MPVSTPVYVITPDSMISNEPYVLAALFKQHSDIARFKKNESYFINYPDETTKVRVELTKSILKRERGNSTEGFRYEIQNETRELRSHGYSKTIGEGSFGRVYPIVGTLKVEEDKVVPCKFNPRVMKKVFLKPSVSAVAGSVKPSKPRGPELAPCAQIYKEKVEKEYSFLSMARHLKAKPLVYTTKGGKEVAYLVTKKLPGSELFEVLSNDQNGIHKLSINQRFRLSCALMKAIKTQIHDLNIVHRDIKLENIMCDVSKDEINFIDFGLSKTVDTSDINIALGTLAYMSPEMMQGQGTTYKSDIYALGKVLIQLWKGTIGDINDATNYLEYAANIPVFPIFLEMPELDKATRDALMALFREMTHPNPDRRCTLDDAQNSLKTIIKDFDEKKKTTKYMQDEIKRSLDLYNAIYPKPDVNNLKSDLMNAIRDYIVETYSQQNVEAKDRAASERRQKDIRDLLDIIHETMDRKELVDKIEARLKTIEGGWLGRTGWLCRSKLRDYITAQINKYTYLGSTLIP